MSCITADTKRLGSNGLGDAQIVAQCESLLLVLLDVRKERFRSMRLSGGLRKYEREIFGDGRGNVTHLPPLERVGIGIA